MAMLSTAEWPSAEFSFALGEARLNLETILRVARQRMPVCLGRVGFANMVQSRAVVDRILADSDDEGRYYGINTGFGGLAEVRISSSQIARLQLNLVRSHAAGVGEPLPRECVRAIMLLRAAVLAQGKSGVRPLVCEHLCECLNRGVHPIIPRRGSVGASGDLAPLAHLALGLIGEGRAEYEGVTMAAREALARAGLAPLVLEAKEGLSLLNGTQHMTALGALTVHDAEKTCLLADLVGAMSFDALFGNPSAFDDRVAAARPQPGQRDVAAHLRGLLALSQLNAQPKARVQDPYSLRCMPQVHGATRDLLGYARRVLEQEANACTDNPLVFPDPHAPHGGVVVSGGNFHGQPVALALDAATMAIAELGSMSERRIEQLVNPQLSNGLPAFLAPDSGLNSGFMIAQVSATALVSENKVLSHPASVDSIPSSAGREDHVSMGAVSALKLQTVHDHVRTVLAIELLCAAQALDLRKPFDTSPPLRAAHACVRRVVPVLGDDRVLSDDIAAVRALLERDALLELATPEGPRWGRGDGTGP